MRITQEDLKEYVANGGDLRRLTKKQIAAIPQEVIKKRAANGGDLRRLTKKQIAAIPQEVIKKRAANGVDLLGLSIGQIAAIPQEVINIGVAKGGSSFGLTAEQRAAIPEQILEFSENAREALILYDAGKIKSSELPSDVFVNSDARQCLLEIIKKKTTMRFAELCKKSGYYKSGVPEEVNMAFDEKLEQIGQEVDERMRSGVKELTGQSEEKQAKSIKEIGEWGW